LLQIRRKKKKGGKGGREGRVKKRIVKLAKRRRGKEKRERRDSSSISPLFLFPRYGRERRRRGKRGRGRYTSYEQNSGPIASSFYLTQTGGKRKGKKGRHAICALFFLLLEKEGEEKGKSQLGCPYLGNGSPLLLPL